MKKGFTLAEVLITLGIIGIIATFTIPTLMNKTNDAELKSAFKETYSQINQAILILAEANGGSIKGAYNNSTEFNNALSQHLRHSNVCISGSTADGGSDGGGATIQGCFHHNKDMPYLDKTENAYSYSVITWPGIVLSNGVLIADSYSSNCTISVDLSTLCAWFQVDVNGFKKPNIIGKDILYIGVKENSVIPFGIKNFYDASTTCQIGSSNPVHGEGCAAKYFYE